MSKLFKNLNKKELSWVLYDVGNSAYTLLACALIPIWYKSLAIGNGSGQISSDKATAYYSLAISIMTVISAFIGPVCGIIADRRGMKKIMFSGSVVLGVAAYICGPDMLGLISNRTSMIIGFTVTGIWWLAVTIPLMKNYKQINYTDGEKIRIFDGFISIFRTIKKIATKDKKVGLFLIAFFLYIDGVGTIIDNCINIGTDLNLNAAGQVIFLLFTQIVACIGSLIFGRLSKKYDTINLIYVCIAGYFVVCIYALMLKNLISFGILAFGVGCFQGAIQALSRSYFAKIIPAENSGEYFGIYDIFAKGASFLGSAVIAGVKFAGGTINVAVAAQAIFFALGFIFLQYANRYGENNTNSTIIKNSDFAKL